MADTFIRYKGLADIFVAVILTIKPSVIYESKLALTGHRVTGLHVSNANSAPGFNQAIACMVAAVGVGHVVASRVPGGAARAPIFAMNLTWAFLSILTCLTPPEWGLSSATTVWTSLNHLVFSGVIWWLDPQVLRFGAVARDKTRRD